MMLQTGVFCLPGVSSPFGLWHVGILQPSSEISESSEDTESSVSLPGPEGETVHDDVVLFRTFTV